MPKGQGGFLLTGSGGRSIRDSRAPLSRYPLNRTGGYGAFGGRIRAIGGLEQTAGRNLSRWTMLPSLVIECWWPQHNRRSGSG